MNRVYFDHTATTPVDNVLEAMLPYFSESFGNPSSVLIEEGGPARQAVDEARGKVADLVGRNLTRLSLPLPPPNQTTWPSRVLRWPTRQGNPDTLLEIEHYSIMHQADFLRSIGFDVEFVKVDENGVLDMADLKKKVTRGTMLVSVMHANMEIGTIRPVKEIARFLKEQGVLFHSDGAGTCGRFPLTSKTWVSMR
jgi:cysteine desulfurase